VIVEVIEWVFADLADCERKELAEWISEVRWMGLVQKLVLSTQDFPHPQQHPNVYSLI
jgi:hypothetical protein